MLRPTDAARSSARIPGLAAIRPNVSWSMTRLLRESRPFRRRSISILPDSIRDRVPEYHPWFRPYVAKSNAIEGLPAASGGSDELGHTLESALDRVFPCQRSRVDGVDG